MWRVTSLLNVRMLPKVFSFTFYLKPSATKKKFLWNHRHESIKILRSKVSKAKSSDCLTTSDTTKSEVDWSLTFLLLFLFLSLCFQFCIILREEDKNIFDYCRENNIDHINKAISSQKVDVNTKDEEVTTKNSTN